VSASHFLIPIIISLPVISLYSTPNPNSPDKASENSGSDAFNPLGSTGSFGSPTSLPRAPSDWTFADKLFDNPRLLHGLVAPGRKCPKELREILRNFGEDIKHTFSKQLFEIVVTTIKNSLSLLRRRFVGPQTSKGLHTVPIPGTRRARSQIYFRRFRPASP